MSNLEKTALKTVKDYSMLSYGDKVIVALSGGADSVALFNFLLSIKDDFSLSVMAVHINHNLRGEESDRDEAFVRKLCKDNNVELFVKSIDINKLAEKEKISTELCGRNQRYNFFKELSIRYNSKIATAHTASDNTETILYNLTRGTGIKGMTGISPARDYIIRPLINCTRQQIEAYCKENNLDFVTDSSNLTDDYTRNKIRHNVVPCLKEFNQTLDSTLSRTSRYFADVNDYLSQQAEDVIVKAKTKNGYDALLLKALHPAIKSFVLYKICKIENIDAEFSHIQLICHSLEKGGAVDLHGEIRAVVKQNTLRFVKTNEEISADFQIDFTIDKSFNYCGKNYKASFLQSNDKDLLSPALLEKNLFFRTRKVGDSFTLPYRNVTKSVKKLLNEYKIPAENRDKLLLLTDGSTIYWIETIGASKQAISSKNGIKITVDT